jgi:hypothetical protein
MIISATNDHLSQFKSDVTPSGDQAERKHIVLLVGQLHRPDASSSLLAVPDRSSLAFATPSAPAHDARRFLNSSSPAPFMHTLLLSPLMRMPVL